MICPSESYDGYVEAPKLWQNWAGTVRQPLDSYFEPTSLDELVHLAVRASAENRRLHAAGSGWAFENAAVSSDWVVHLPAAGVASVGPRGITSALGYVVGPDNFALTEDWQKTQLNPSSPRRLVHFEAGIDIGDLSQRLWEQGLSLETLGGANGQSLAGAISTGTHGGDLNHPPIGDLVEALHIVSEGGQELWIERSSRRITVEDRLMRVLPCPHTRILHDDEIFNAAVLSFGRFGVIYSVVLRVERAFRLEEHTTQQNTTKVLDALRSGAGERPLDALWRFLPPPSNGPAIPMAALRPRHTEIDFATQSPDQCWVRRRWITKKHGQRLSEPPALPWAPRESGMVVLLAALSLLQGHLPSLAVFPPLKAKVMQEMDRLAALAQDPDLSFGRALASGVNSLWRLQDEGVPTIAPHVISHLSFHALKAQMQDSMEGIWGPAYLVMTGTRESNRNQPYRGASVEVTFPADDAVYVDYLERVLEQCTSYRQLGYIAVRYCARSESTLSMHNFPSRHAVSIEIASLNGLQGNERWFRDVERWAIEVGGRPHWGQHNRLTSVEVAKLYGEKVGSWRRALLAACGHAPTFSNSYTLRRGLEPVEAVREVRATRKSKDGAITHLCMETEDELVAVSVEDVAAELARGQSWYVADVSGSLTRIGVVDYPNGNTYVRTVPNNRAEDNLDMLPDC